MICGSTVSRMLLALCLPTLALSATLFQDDFSNATQSQADWKDISNNLAETYAGGVLSVANNSQYFGLLTHTISCSTFTYSARVRPLKDPYQTIGLVCCGALGASYYRGYLFTIMSGQQYTIYKMAPTGVTPVYQTWHSHVRAGENVLTIIKGGSHLLFFANGVFLKGITDADYGGGEIGLALDKGQSMQVDDVLLTDQYADGRDVKYFRDRFDDANLPGWNLSDAGAGWKYPVNAQVSGGVLTVVGTDSASASIFYTEGLFKNSPVRVRARFKSGAQTSFYGLMLIQLQKTFGASGVGIGIAGSSGFVVSGSREWGTFSSGAWIPAFSDTVRGGGQWDTLEVTSAMEFLVNGKKLGTYNEQVFDYNAAGITVPHGVTVEFDDFTAGDSANSAVVFGPRSRPAPLSRLSLARGGRVIVTDLLGRSAPRARAAPGAAGARVLWSGGNASIAAPGADAIVAPW